MHSKHKATKLEGRGDGSLSCGGELLYRDFCVVSLLGDEK